MEIDERPDSRAGFGESGRETVEGLVLGRVTRSETAICLVAGIGGGTTLGRLGVPFEFPVPVAVGADAGRV